MPYSLYFIAFLSPRKVGNPANPLLGSNLSAIAVESLSQEAGGANLSAIGSLPTSELLWERAERALDEFVSHPDFVETLHRAFEENWSEGEWQSAIATLKSESVRPQIEIVSRSELQANGAYAAENNTIYLAQEFVRENSLEIVDRTVLEEIGHYFDSRLNAKDAAGDEGDIFAAGVLGEELSEGEIKTLKQESDRVTRTIGGETLELELNNGTGLLGKYYDDLDFGNLALTRTDAQVDFDWQTGSPDPNIAADTFSVQWSGEIEALYSETYTFYTRGEEGVRLKVNGQVLIDNWNSGLWEEHFGTIALVAGQKYEIELDYYENAGNASIELLWESASQAKAIVPQTHLYAAEPQLPMGVAGSGTGLLGNYYDGLDFSNPILTRTDAVIDFDWQTGSPDPNIAADTFSVKWTGEIEALYTETYTFYTEGEEGVRLKVNGQVLVDNWNNGFWEQHSGTIALVAGQKYDIELDYYENVGNASIELLWESSSQTKEIVPQAFLYGGEIPLPTGVEGQGTGLLGKYYDGLDFSNPILERVDDRIDFHWQNGSPDPSIAPDTFSVKWTGQIEALYTETYTFYTEGEEGVRLKVNGQVLVDNWNNGFWEQHSGTIALVAGQKYDIELDYYENVGNASIELLWESASQTKAIVPKAFLYEGESPLPIGVEGEGTGLLGKYYDGLNFTDPILERVDDRIDFHWQNGSPDPSIAPDTFSVKWTGQIEALYTENYTFYTEGEEGVRLKVNGQVLIDNWNNGGFEQHFGTIALEAGQKYDIELDYYENGGWASIELLWESISQTKEIVPQAFLYAGELPLPIGVEGEGTGLLGKYYDNLDFSNPVLERVDDRIDFHWQMGSPDPSIAADTFSVKWTGQIEALYTETYTFHTKGEEGVRLKVNGQVLVDNWNNGGLEEYFGTIALEAGQKYDIELDYYENGGWASIELLWESASQSKEIVPQAFLYAGEIALSNRVEGQGIGLKAEYYDDMTFGQLVASRIDPQVDFTWGLGSPDPAVAPDTFSARWTGQIEAIYDEEYTFYTKSDDGVRLWVNGQLLIDNWTNHALTENFGKINLLAGERYDIKLEYYEHGIDATVRLLWESASQTKAIVPGAYLYPSKIEITAALVNDTGTSNSDRITQDATITGNLTSENPLANFKAGFAGTREEFFSDLSGDLDGSGNFTLSLARLEAIYGSSLTDGEYTLELIAEDSVGTKSDRLLVTFVLDTTAPDFALITPSATGENSQNVRLIGAVVEEGGISSAQYTLDGSSAVTLNVDPKNAFNQQFASLGIGSHQAILQAIDLAGNQGQKTVDFQVVADVVVIGPDPSGGWVTKTGDETTLGEDDSFVVQTSMLIDLGQSQGSRTLRFELAPEFDTSDTSALKEDQFLVYIADPNNPDQTLLDRGQQGTALFSLTGDKADFVPGLVRYDGTAVEIDLTSFQGFGQGLLVFQLLNNDGDMGTRVEVRNITNTLDPEGEERPVFPMSSDLVEPGSTMNLSGLSETQDVEVNLTNVRLDVNSGRYVAELQVRNTGIALGRQLAVVFPNLPSGVQLEGASGVDGTGAPYLNLQDALPTGGLDTGAVSRPVELVLENPNLVRLDLMPKVLTGGANQAPIFPTIAPITLKPGEHLALPLSATDPDGSPVNFSIDASVALPTGRLQADGTLILTPTPDQIGMYQVTIAATDGIAETSQVVTVNVVADPVTTTRVSGVIENISEQPLAGVVIELGSLQTTTAADGSFVLETSGALDGDAVIVRGDTIGGAEVYPYIAEKLPLVLGHEVYENFNNVIARPIYLPPIDVANAVSTPVSGGTLYTTNTIADASVFIATGTIEDQQGNPFAGQLSITQVPNELTPAALPAHLIPDMVVTIQPGEMVLTQPAPLTLPNLAGYLPNTMMNLWSINPQTGDFDNVGTGRVSFDGTKVETISGGIRNSSWHFFTPPPPPSAKDPAEDPRNPDDRCDECKADADLTSRVQLHSGAVVETHNLVSYSSLGASRGLTLTYDSLRADPRPILHFGYENAVANSDELLIAELTVKRGAFEFQVPGYAGGQYGLDGGEHFWSLPEAGGTIDAALQADMSELPSGRYDYELSTGLRRFTGSLFAGSTHTSTGQFLHVNGLDSPFGEGWGLSGWQQLVENPDGSVLLIDGDGSEQLFELGTNGYENPPGDFSILEKVNGLFQRTLKDGMVYLFNGENKIESMTDRLGNATRYIYDAASKLVKIVDPANLETLLGYTGDRVTSITDPANRVTQLIYDARGNLEKIIDPDQSSRTWEYDSGHRMIAETDQRNEREETLYDFAGRARGAIAKDGSLKFVDIVQVQGLYTPEATIDPFNAPTAWELGAVESRYADGNGNTSVTEVDKAGQTTSAKDGVGNLPSVFRDDDNLVTSRADARGNGTLYTYDDRGNVTKIVNPFETTLEVNTLFGSQRVFIKDMNGDGDDDILSIGYGRIHLLFNDGNDGLSNPTYLLGSVNDGISIGDLNGDFANDIFNAATRRLNSGDGNFSPQAVYPDDYISLLDGVNIRHSRLSDLNNDGNLDLIVGREYINFGHLTIVWGNGQGDFTSATSLPALTSTQAVVGDVNGDNYNDIVNIERVFNNNFSVIEEKLQVFLNDGTGNFSLAFSDNVTGYSPYENQVGNSVLLEDLNGDNHLDFIWASPSEDLVGVRLGNGNGSFGAEMLYSLETEGNSVVNSVAVGDMNNDDIPDVIATETVNGRVVIFYGNGDINGTLTKGISLKTSQPHFLREVNVSDWNDDGYIDLIIANNDKVSIYLNGGERSYTYDPVFNKVTSMTDELGRQTLYDIDPITGNLMSTTRVVGEVGGTDDVITSYTYTAEGLTDTVTDPLGRITDYDYNPLGQLIKTTFAKGTLDEAFQSYEYDLAGNQTAVIDENGIRTENKYDKRNRLIKTIFAKGTEDEATQEFEYDLAGNQTAVIDENGNRTEHKYDAMGRLLEIIGEDPDGADILAPPVTRYEYDLGGNQIAVIDPLGRRSESRYDERDRLIESIAPDGTSTTQSYDADNNLIASTDTNGNNSRQVHDPRGRLIEDIREVNGVEEINRFGYDAANQMISQIDAKGNITEYTYDELGRRETVTSGVGTAIASTTTTKYDKVGNITEVIDGLQHKTTYDYDDRNRRIKITNALDQPGITILDYDDAGNLIEVIDLEQNTTNFVYDARNRLKSETNQLSHTRSYIYDNVGNLIRESDRNNRVTEYEYDALNRRIAENWLDAQNNIINSITSSYDAASQLIETGDEDSSYRYTYDAIGRPLTITYINNFGIPSVQLTYDYDENGNLASVKDTLNGIDTGLIAYSYDDLNRIASIAQSGTGVSEKRVDYGYDKVGNYESIKRYKDLNGTQLVTQSDYTYDAMNRLDTLIHHNGVTNLATYDLDYDLASRIEQIIDIDGTSTYTYDKTNQLTDVTHTDVNNPNEFYRYDDNGNRTQSSQHANYTPGTNNRLDSDGVYNYQYDNEGNLIMKTEIATGDVTELQWDYRNRLVAFIEKDASNAVLQRVDYIYDAMNRRIAQTVDNTPNDGIAGDSTYYVYNGNNVLLDYEAMGGGTPTLAQRYLHGARVDEILAQESETGEVLWHLSDHLGTIRDLVNNNGAVANHLTYDSFGNVVNETDGTIDTRYLFTGREYDEATGLYYYRARYYDAGIGRFMSEDPIGFESGDTNLYRYVGNNPVSFTDPTGEKVYIGWRPFPAAGEGRVDDFLDFTIGVAKHLTMILIPDDSCAFGSFGIFNENLRFEGKLYGTLSGWPRSNYITCRTRTRGDWTERRLKNLAIDQNLPADRIEELAEQKVEVQPPAGKNDTQFINDLIKADERYQDNAVYPLFGIPNGLGVQYNSGSAVLGLLEQAGITSPPNLPVWAPGYNFPRRTLPIPYTLPSYCRR